MAGRTMSDSAASSRDLVFFLGGYDLEMLTIRELLAAEGAPFWDKELAWGAQASAYAAEIEQTLAIGHGQADGNELPIAGRRRVHVVASLRDAKPGLGETGPREAATLDFRPLALVRLTARRRHARDLGTTPIRGLTHARAYGGC